ncbi:hypothetical protein CEUSTIGMA_g7995.t1, partial [Chlamydomonas eustigma]
MSDFCSLGSGDVSGKIPITIEVQLKPDSCASAPDIKTMTKRALDEKVFLNYQDGPIDPHHFSGFPLLVKEVESMTICDCDARVGPKIGSPTMFWSWVLNIHVYKLSLDEPEDDEGEDGEDGGGEDGPVSMYREWPLPAKELHGLWDSLHYEDDESNVEEDTCLSSCTDQSSCSSIVASSLGAVASNAVSQGGTKPQAGDATWRGGILHAAAGDGGGRRRGTEGASQGGQTRQHAATSVKRRLLNYAGSALLFSERGVDGSLISWNRVVLLHGPPGTGKTSLCKALAQKLSVRLGSRYPAGCSLVEVNAHSLFSRYFSESGKLVGRLFARLSELVEDGDALVFVLIDEVESLAAARKAGSSEPTDAIRAVNALLTQLDRLRRFPNVMILTTSNITGAIDAAFVDRADIKAYIGPPSLHARYNVLRSAIKELVRAKILLIPSSKAAEVHGQHEGGDNLHGLKVDDCGHACQLAEQMLLPFPVALEEMNRRSSQQRQQSDARSACSAHGRVSVLKPGNAAQSVGAEVVQVAQPAAVLVLTRPDDPMDTSAAQDQGVGSSPTAEEEAAAAAALGIEYSLGLLEAAAACEGLSGRILRKLPFLTHAV